MKPFKYVCPEDIEEMAMKLSCTFDGFMGLGELNHIHRVKAEPEVYEPSHDLPLIA